MGWFRRAAAVVRNLKLFEKPGGLETSTNLSGNQGDAPFAWAPPEMIAVEGLRRYGNHAESGTYFATRIPFAGQGAVPAA